MAEYPKVCLGHRDADGGRGTWLEGWTNPTHKVVPLSAVVIERDDNGQWPDGAPLRAASDAYRTRMKAGGLPIAAL